MYCPVTADERSYAHTQDALETYQNYIEAESSDKTDQLYADMQSVRKDTLFRGYSILKLSHNSLDLLQQVLSDLPEEVYSTAEAMVISDIEASKNGI